MGDLHQIANVVSYAVAREYSKRRKVHSPGYAPRKEHFTFFSRAADVVVSTVKVRNPRAEEKEFVTAAENFVAAQFELWPGERGYPYPNMIYGPGAKDRFEKFQASRPNYSSEALVVQEHYLLNYIVRRNKDPDDVLLDPSTPFKAWFRILAISEERFERACQLFWKDALRVAENMPLVEVIKSKKKYARIFLLVPDPTVPVSCPGPLRPGN